MGNNLIDALDQILSDDQSTTNLPPQVLEIEQQLTACLISKPISIDLPDVDQLAACFEGADAPIEVSINLLQHGYPYHLRPWQKFQLFISSRLLKRGDLFVSIPVLLDQYMVDDEFMNNVSKFLTRINQLYQDETNQFEELELPLWSREKTRLFHRCILQGMMIAWSKDQSDQPIQWNISERLEQLLDNGSPSAISEGFYQLMLVGLSRRVTQSSTDTLLEFLEESNEDKNGNLLDNFYLAKDSYAKLIKDGWEPDRWEIENLPLVIDLYFSFMKSIGLNQNTNLGDVFEISLKQALEEYRYNGSPFDSSDDKKNVIVIAPGWTYQEEAVVRPKVREVTE